MSVVSPIIATRSSGPPASRPASSVASGTRCIFLREPEWSAKTLIFEFDIALTVHRDKLCNRTKVMSFIFDNILYMFGIGKLVSAPP